jgi:hypothetical protein
MFPPLGLLQRRASAAPCGDSTAKFEELSHVFALRPRVISDTVD